MLCVVLCCVVLCFVVCCVLCVVCCVLCVVLCCVVWGDVGGGVVCVCGRENGEGRGRGGERSGWVGLGWSWWWFGHSCSMCVFLHAMHTCKLIMGPCPCGHPLLLPALHLCAGPQKPSASTSAPATESKSAILAHIQLDKPWLRSLRDALHIRNVEGNRQVCIGAQVDVSTLSPVI